MVSIWWLIPDSGQHLPAADFNAPLLTVVNAPLPPSNLRGGVGYHRRRGWARWHQRRRAACTLYNSPSKIRGGQGGVEISGRGVLTAVGYLSPHWENVLLCFFGFWFVFVRRVAFITNNENTIAVGLKMAEKVVVLSLFFGIILSENTNRCLSDG